MCYFLYLIVRFLYAFFKKTTDGYYQADGKAEENYGLGSTIWLLQNLTIQCLCIRLTAGFFFEALLCKGQIERQHTVDSAYWISPPCLIGAVTHSLPVDDSLHYYYTSHLKRFFAQWHNQSLSSLPSVSFSSVHSMPFHSRKLHQALTAASPEG